MKQHVVALMALAFSGALRGAGIAPAAGAPAKPLPHHAREAMKEVASAFRQIDAAYRFIDDYKKDPATTADQYRQKFELIEEKNKDLQPLLDEAKRAAAKAGAPDPNVLWEQDLGALGKGVAEHAGARALRAAEGYAVFTSARFGKALGQTALVVEVEAASPDGAQLGARVQFLDGRGGPLDASNALWHEPLAAGWRKCRGEVVPNSADADAARVLLYRSNRKGTLFLRSVAIRRKALAPTGELVAALEARLRAEGYQTGRAGGYLVGKKPDERCYYRIPPEEQVDPEGFDRRSYAGSTWLREKTPPEFFPIGPYVYGPPDVQRERARAQGLSLPEYFQHLAQDVKAHGGTAIYYANLTMDPEVFRVAVAAAAKHGLRVFGQLTQDLYLRPERGRAHYEQTTVPTAERILPQYRGLAGVAGWMPKEEAAPDEIGLVAEYRRLVRRLDPTHALFTLHNRVETFRRETGDLPEWFGFDRYRFRCLKAAYGMLISTPRDMAQRLRAEIADCAREAEKRGRPLVYVLQGYGHQNLFTTAEIKAWSGGARDRLDPWSGFREIRPGVWKGWDRYPPPEHGMRLQAWLAVLEGARGLLIYYYGPAAPQDGLKQVTLVDDAGRPTRLWTEFGACMEEMKPFLPLFRTWHKEAIARAAADHPDIAVGSFLRRLDGERYLVVLNQRIATWDEDSPPLPRGKTALHFDEEGLAGLRPAGPLTFSLRVEGSDPVWDVRTGRRLQPDADGSYRLSLGPAGAAVLRQATP